MAHEISLREDFSTYITKHRLPVKEICRQFNVRRKFVETWRRYLLTLFLILTDDDLIMIRRILYHLLRKEVVNMKAVKAHLRIGENSIIVLTSEESFTRPLPKGDIQVGDEILVPVRKHPISQCSIRCCSCMAVVVCLLCLLLVQWLPLHIMSMWIYLEIQR